MLGLGGFFVCRSVFRALTRAGRESRAIAEGDVSLRLAPDNAAEIGELVRNFNRVTDRLQETIHSLQTSKEQIHLLMSRICEATGSQSVDLPRMLDVFLGTLLSLTGLDVGAIFLLSPDRKSLLVGAARGFEPDIRSTVVPAGRGIAGWVASTGQTVTTSGSAPGEFRHGLTFLEKSMPWGIHLPLTASGKIRGVMSIGSRAERSGIAGEELRLIRNLAAQVAVTLENTELKEEMERAYIETVASLATAVEARDEYTRGHSRRVTGYAVEIARKMNMPEEFVKDLEAASLLHDIGKIGMPDSILHNSGPLPPEGLAFILGHPVGGENILKPVGSLARLCPIVRHHHERFDGDGYPDRLKGKDIPLASRILAVSDSFDAMVSDRAYRPTRNREEAMEELKRHKGTQFDAEVVDVFLSCLKVIPRVDASCLS
jgi:HAMP domain-containing protein